MKLTWLASKTIDMKSDFMSSQWASVNYALRTCKVLLLQERLGSSRLWTAYDSTANQVSSDRELVSKSGTVYTGLPVIGFMATILQNSNVGDGAAYASTAEHRYVRSMSQQVEPR